MSNLSINARAFKEVPKDVRQWTVWIREAFTQAISGTIGTVFLDDAAVTYAKFQNIATDTLVGRSTAGSGPPEAITCTAAGRALIDDAAASNQRTTLGLGTSAVVDTGTSGTKVALLDGANTWTLQQVFSAAPQVPNYAVASLPSAATAGFGALAMVNDATLTAITGLGLAPTGGGANKVPVYSDGASWLML